MPEDDYDNENSWISRGLPGAAEEGGEARPGRGERGRKKKVQQKSTLESTASKARSRSRARVAMNGAPRISPRVSGKSPSLASSSLSSSVQVVPQQSRRHRHAWLQRRYWCVNWPPRCYHQSKKMDDEPRDPKRRCDIMLDFVSAGRASCVRRSVQKFLKSQRLFCTKPLYVMRYTVHEPIIS